MTIMKNIAQYFNTARRCLAVALAMIVCGAAVAQSTDTVCPPRTLPWSESFEEQEETVLQCWTTIAAWYGYPLVYHYGFAHEGGSSLAMTSGGATEPCMIATPRMGHRADSLHVGFWLTMNADDGTLLVGLYDTAFVPMLTVDLSTAELGYYEFYTDNYVGTDSVAVAFRIEGGRIAIDDVEVEAASSCRRPWQPWIANLSYDMVTVGWSIPSGTPSSYLVRVVDIAAADTFFLSTYTTQCNIYDLDPATTYEIAVAAVCGSEVTGWLIIGTVTTDVACRAVRSAGIEVLAANAAGLRWENDLTGVNPPTGILLDYRDMQSLTTERLTFAPTVDHTFLDSLSTGHRYLVELRTVCDVDTAAPISLMFTPLDDFCTGHTGPYNTALYPFNAYTYYNYAQMLYPGSFVAGMDSLYAVAFHCVSASSFGDRLFDLYVGSTTDSVLTGNISTLTMRKAVNGRTLDRTADGWIVIPFDYPVPCDTAHNLVLTVVDRTGFVSGMLRFATHNEPFGGTLYGSSSNPINPLDEGLVVTSATTVPDVRLYGNCAGAACQPPVAMVTAAGEHSLTVEWVGATSCVLLYRISDAAAWTTVNAVTSPYILTGLDAATHYLIQLGRVCGSDTAFSDIIEVMTQCGIVEVPYIADFSQGGNPCWTPMAGARIVSPEINAAANTLQVRLMLRGQEPSARVAVGVCNADGSSPVWVDTVAAPFNAYEERVAYIIGYQGTARHIVLGYLGGLNVQWVGIEEQDDCLPPRQLTVSAVAGNRATLSWIGTAGAMYDVYLIEAESGRQAVWHTANTQIILEGLAPNTMYEGYVVARCADNLPPSVQAPFSFGTSCDAIRHFPYREDFEEPAAPAQCWRIAYGDHTNSNVNPMIHTTNQAFSGHRSFRFSSYNTLSSGQYDQYLISPRIVADDSIWVTFACRKDNLASEAFAVGFSTASDAVEDFLWMNTVEPQAGSWQQYTIGFPDLTRYIAIHYMGQNNYYLYIDALTISGPGCEAPVVTAVDEQAESVTVEWNAQGDTSFVAITDGIWISSVQGTPVLDGSYTFGSLESGRSYTVGIRSRCPDGNMSDWTTMQLTTINTSCIAPTGLTLDEVSYTSATVSWIPAEGQHSWQLELLADVPEMSQPINATSYVITDLEQNKSYGVVVRSLCGGIPGPWSDTLWFSTMECQPVENLTYQRIDLRTVSVNWQVPAITTGRQRVEYGERGFMRGTGTIAEVTVTPYVITDMHPDMDYEVYVQNSCQTGVWSDSAAYLLIPSPLAIGGVAMESLVLYPNPASEQVTVGGLQPGAVVTVLDVAGRTVVPAVQCPPSGVMRLDISRLAPGTYFVRATDASGTAVAKLAVK